VADRLADPAHTHGRHCRCTPCARQDWSLPHLAPCGMHGASCPAVYQPESREAWEARHPEYRRQPVPAQLGEARS
jgi:hypothetical protein